MKHLHREGGSLRSSLRALGRAVACIGVIATGAGCKSAGATPSPPTGAANNPIAVTSAAFAVNAPIPVVFTCDGRDVSPPLAWTAPPEAARGFALIVDDPDAPGGTFNHWLVWNLPKDARSLAEGADIAALGAKVGTNDFKDARYRGPCPPRGSTHRYRFRVIAVDAAIEPASPHDRAALDAALRGHVLAEGTLTGRFNH